MYYKKPNHYPYALRKQYDVIYVTLPLAFVYKMATNVYPVKTTVSIDGRGTATIVGHKSSTAGEIYTVLVDGIDFEIDLPADRLSVIQNAEATEKENDRFREVSVSTLKTLLLMTRWHGTFVARCRKVSTKRSARSLPSLPLAVRTLLPLVSFGM